MIDGTAVTAIAELAQGAQGAEERIAYVDSVAFSTTPLHRFLPERSPAPEPLRVSTLAALVAYIEENPDDINPDACIINVDSPTAVSLLGALHGYHRQRFHYMIATAALPTQFAFGKFLPHAEFVTGLMSLFSGEGDRNDLMQTIRRVQMTSSVQLADDGITQSVEAKKGVSLVEQLGLPTHVQLAPYRTFPEAGAPLSAFLLRVRHDATRGFEAALFEADGGWWRVKATEGIVAFLKDTLSDSSAKSAPAILF
jgi:hypothetical protein